MSKKGGLLTGLLVGAGLGVLFAPKKGSETRAELKLKINELYEKLKDVEFNDVKESIEQKLKELQKDLKSLDGEKIGAIARKQAENIKDKAEDLYRLAVDKGSPILQKAADDVRQKTIELLNNAAHSLDKNNEKTPKAKNTPKKPTKKTA